MTPFEFRQKALQNLRDARALHYSSPTNAVYLAGYAVEFSLKSRVCTHRAWKRWPIDRAELREWNAREGRNPNEKLFVHDLEALFKVSDATILRASDYAGIDWNRALDWSEQVRYASPYMYGAHEALDVIEEHERVVEQLLLLERLDALLQIEIETARTYGPFNCFAYAQDPESGLYGLWLSWCAPSADELRRREMDLHFKVNNQLDPDLKGGIAFTRVLHPQEPMLRGLYAMLGFFGGSVQHSIWARFSNNIVFGYPSFPNGYVITAGNWSEGALHDAWKSPPLS